jgi:tetratricopeptide (TPR) repeat protein
MGCGSSVPASSPTKTSSSPSSLIDVPASLPTEAPVINEPITATRDDLNKPGGFSIVWLDKIANRHTVQTEKMQGYLRDLTHNLICCRQLEQCLEWIEHCQDDKIITIVSAESVSEELQYFPSYSIIKAIFIFGPAATRFSHLVKGPEKRVKVGVCVDIEELLKKIEYFILESIEIECSYPFSVLNNQNTTQDLSENCIPFLCFRLLMSVLNYTGSHSSWDERKNAKAEMLETCKNFVENDTIQLLHIKEFERHYDASEALRWYTKDCFLYDMVNGILRSEDILLLYSIRLFISDLHSQIEHMHKDDPNHRTRIVYRGLIMLKKQLHAIQQSKLILPNGFLSSSTNKAVALDYIHRKMNEKPSDFVSCLLEIQLNDQATQTCYANIYNISFSTEAEILFGCGTVFKIIKIGHEEDVYVIYMQPSDEGMNFIKNYPKMVTQQIRNHDPTLLFGQFLIDMGQYEKATVFFQNLLKWSTAEDMNRPDILDSLGHILLENGKKHDAYQKFQTAYKLRQRFLPPTHPDIGRSLTNLGAVMLAQQYYDSALDYFNRAKKILKADDRYLLFLGPVYSGLAKLHVCRDNLSEAEENYKKLLLIHKQLQLPEAHEFVGQYWCGMMQIHAKSSEGMTTDNGYLNKVLEDYQHAREVYRKIAPMDHLIHKRLDTELYIIQTRYKHQSYRQKLPFRNETFSSKDTASTYINEFKNSSRSTSSERQVSNC